MYPPEKQTATSAVVPNSPTPPYQEVALPARDEEASHPSKLNPKSWGRKAWLVIAVVAIAVIIGAVVGGVLGARANAYPNYYQIKYRLQDTYETDNFFSQFDYFTGYDPTHGFVHYVDSEGSMAQNLTSVSTSTPTDTLSGNRSSVILRVDTSDTNATTGRRSVRISSKKTYSTGLFLFDILHTPYGCATWPALWLVDEANWPANGEIDVVESVNVGDTGNQMTLHTSKDCKIGKHRKRKQTGDALTYDCWNATNSNSGCGVQGPANSYGEAFNNNGGGVYALEVRNEGIRVWMFPRSSIPSDITSGQPDPSTWGIAMADFPNLECDISSHFKNQSIVANIDLCGDWAGQKSIFGSNAMCTGTCSDWVAHQADSFREAYWEFGGFWVYRAS